MKIRSGRTATDPRGIMMKVVLVLVLIGTVSSCATIGYDFPSSRVQDIQVGKTTREEIRTMFGAPWRTGVEDGQPTWTYAKYYVNIFGYARTKDLLVRFDSAGVVRSYSFNTTEP